MKWEHILAFSALVLAVVLVNIHAGSAFFRLDLTEEGRFTLSEATKQSLQNLDDVVYVEVFLDGDLNPSFKRLQQAIRERLEEFKLYAGNNFQYKFTNPDDAVSEEDRNRFYKQLVDRGLSPTSLFENVNGKRVQRLIFPGAVISFQGREEAVLLLKGNKNSSPQEQINQSAEGVEYELATGIRRLSIKNKKRVAFIQGHDELRKQDVASLSVALNDFYTVEHTRIGETPLEAYNAVIIAQPKTKFTESENFLLDQYIVGGGSAMFLLDPIQMNIDSIANGGTYAFGYDLGLEELLFRYGIKLENTLIQDQQAGLIEIYTGNFGDKPQLQQMPWPYYAYLNTFSEHPIVRNMDVIYGKFVSTLDTNVSVQNIKRTPLVFTSKYSRTRKMPGLVDLNELKELKEVKDIQQLYKESNIPVAYLLEGEFKSLYANRGAPTIYRDRKVIASGKSKILVFADADIIRNEFNKQNGKPEPIDYDKYRKQALSNIEFIVNSLEYMTDENGLINARKTQITLRPLDTLRAKEDKGFWQFTNIVLPVLLIVSFGLGFQYLRKKRYASFKKNE